MRREQICRSEEGPNERHEPTIEHDDELVDCCAQFISYAASVNADCVYRDNSRETTLERIANARDYLDAIEKYVRKALKSDVSTRSQSEEEPR